MEIIARILYFSFRMLAYMLGLAVMCFLVLWATTLLVYAEDREEPQTYNYQRTEPTKVIVTNAHVGHPVDMDESGVTNSSVAQCEEWNKSVHARVAWVARQIAARPDLGYIWQDTLRTMHTMWDTRCL